MKAKKDSNTALTSFVQAGALAPAGLSALASLGSEAKSGAGGAFLTFNKFGEFRLGKEQLEVEPEDLFAVNPNSFQSGFIAWSNKRVVGERMKLITEGNVSKAELPEVDSKDGWQAQLAMSLKEVAGDGIECQFKSSTYGGKQAVAGLAEAIAKRAAEAPDSCIPVVSCDKSSYEHSEYGKIFTPKFVVTAWMNGEGEVAEQIAGG